MTVDCEYKDLMSTRCSRVFLFSMYNVCIEYLFLEVEK